MKKDNYNIKFNAVFSPVEEVVNIYMNKNDKCIIKYVDVKKEMKFLNKVKNEKKRVK